MRELILATAIAALIIGAALWIGWMSLHCCNGSNLRLVAA
jgi:hypothetical protein